MSFSFSSIYRIKEKKQIFKLHFVLALVPFYTFTSKKAPTTTKNTQEKPVFDCYPPCLLS